MDIYKLKKYGKVNLEKHYTDAGSYLGWHFLVGNRVRAAYKAEVDIYSFDFDGMNHLDIHKDLTDAQVLKILDIVFEKGTQTP
jgi:hypothetical protein